MIHLVVVSHSRRIADGVVELMRQIAPSELAISAVGGMEEDGSLLLGTNPLEIAAALTAHTGPDGALILVDLGSSVLSAETALDLIDPALAARCRISNAPLVEGAVVAAVEAGLRHTLDEVNQAAEAAGTMNKVIGR
jgi:dihydroxyacetone kinase phosphotransfer subunit